MGALLEVYVDDVGRVLAERDRLLLEQEACGDEAAQDMLEAVEACQVRHAWACASFSVCVCVCVHVCVCVFVRACARACTQVHAGACVRARGHAHCLSLFRAFFRLRLFLYLCLCRQPRLARPGPVRN